MQIVIDPPVKSENKWWQSIAAESSQSEKEEGNTKA